MPPRMLPTATPRFPAVAALIVIATSGRLVATASTMMPPSALPSLSREERMSVVSASLTPAIQITPAHPAKIASKTGRLSLSNISSSLSVDDRRVAGFSEPKDRAFPAILGTDRSPRKHRTRACRGFERLISSRSRGNLRLQSSVTCSSRIIAVTGAISAYRGRKARPAFTRLLASKCSSQLVRMKTRS